MKPRLLYETITTSFGVYFEWGKSPTTEVTIQVSESDEEDDPDEDGYDDEEYTVSGSGDPERGAGGGPGAKGGTRPLLSLVVSVYRRDCHTEVYAGSHTYPGEGVYLLKFDNTYSLWRSKTLYYKIYYTQ